MPRRTALVLEPDYWVRRGLREQLRERCGKAMEVAEAASGREAAALLGIGRPELLVLEPDLPDYTLEDVCGRLIGAFPHVRAVAFTHRAEVATVAACLRSGAKGYVLKETGPDDLIAAIEQALQGRRWVAPSVLDTLLAPNSPTAVRAAGPDGVRLGQKDLEVLELVAAGKTNKAIAAALGLSANSVRHRLERIFERLDVAARAEAVERGHQLGLLCCHCNGGDLLAS